MFHPSSLCYSPSWQASTGFRERVTSDLVVHRVIDIWMVKLSRAGWWSKLLVRIEVELAKQLTASIE